jgi:hypothetical protein
VFRQNGPKANSGALFLAVSVEQDVSQSHTISPNGYNLGRCVPRRRLCYAVSYMACSAATSSSLTRSVPPHTVASPTLPRPRTLRASSPRAATASTTVSLLTRIRNVACLTPYFLVPGIAQDGIVTLLTVNVS